MSENRKSYAERYADPDDIFFLSSTIAGNWYTDESSTSSLSLDLVAQLLSELDPATRLKLVTAEAEIRLGK